MRTGSVAAVTSKNWAGNYTFTAEQHHQPGSLDELATIVAAAERIRPVGSRHSFTGIADSVAQVSLDGLPTRFDVAADRTTVTVSAHINYGRLATLLQAEGLAVHNMASLPQITIAGAIATGTHGSGDGNGNLATSVVAVEFLTSAGETVTVERGDEDFPGAVVSLGALGVLIAVTLAVQPAFEMRQMVIEEVPWQSFDDFDSVFASAYSVSAFHQFGATIDQLWIKQLSEDDVPAPLFGGRLADEERHPLVGLPPTHCTPQLGRIGPWWDRLPHFRLESSPNAGDEIQSEFFVARGDGPAAIEALRSVGHRLTPALMVNEIRTVAGDELWMSPHYRRPSVALHFTWHSDPIPTRIAIEAVEEALLPFNPRPHWGKVFTPQRFPAAESYPELGRFLDLAERLDQRQAFRNRWFDEVVTAS